MNEYKQYNKQSKKISALVILDHPVKKTTMKKKKIYNCCTHAQASVYERHVVVSGKKLKNM